MTKLERLDEAQKGMSAKQRDIFAHLLIGALSVEVSDKNWDDCLLVAAMALRLRVSWGVRDEPRPLAVLRPALDRCAAGGRYRAGAGVSGAEIGRMGIVSNFTPGPWDHDSGMYGNGKTYHTIFAVTEDMVIAEFNAMPEFNPEQGKANARLITVAPAMYEALTLILQEYDTNTTGMAMARAALAKAEGRQP